MNESAVKDTPITGNPNPLPPSIPVWLWIMAIVLATLAYGCNGFKHDWKVAIYLDENGEQGAEVTNITELIEYPGYNTNDKPVVSTEVIKIVEGDD